MAKTKQDQKRAVGEKTRKKILRESVRLFARHGYAGTSVQMIAKAAGVGKSAVFWHFETKEKLLQEVLEKIVSDFIGDVLNAARSGRDLDEASLISLALATDKKLTTRDLQGSRAVFALMIESANFNNEAAPSFRNRWNLYRGFFANVVRTGQKNGRFRKDVDPRWAGIMIVGLLNGVFSQWFVDPDAVDLVESYKQIEKVTINYLTEKGS